MGKYMIEPVAQTGQTWGKKIIGQWDKTVFK